jgi:hypothetical protein
MNLKATPVALIAMFALVAAPCAFAQERKVSPAGTAEVSLDGKTITINYSRPFMKGRKIMGGVVPYGHWWRTGADDATALSTPVDLEIGGAKVPAGNYTIYTLPSETDWKLIINKQTGQWGTEYDESQDLARVDLKKTSLARPIEEFTMEFVKKSPTETELVLEWENTKLSVPVRVMR